MKRLPKKITKATMKRFEREIEDIKKKNEWFINFIDSLDFDEIESLYKSNRFSRKDRQWYYHCYKPNRKIRELIPLIGIIAVSSIIMELIIKVQHEKTTKNNNPRRI